MVTLLDAATDLSRPPFHTRAENFGGKATHQSPRRKVARNDRTGCDHASITQGGVFQNRDAGADPDISTNAHSRGLATANKCV
jgi:hypothetical protein